jgi:prepilin-type N-terminal cleavage/methylation domain-containing protein
MAFRSRWSSFTLVEMLVAMAVLSLLLLLIFSIVGASLKISDTTGRGADSSNEAKQVLDRIGVDIAGMLNRPDIDQFYYKAVGNDKMFFYTQQTGFFDSTVIAAGESPVTFVGYRIDTNTLVNPAAPALERLGQGLDWDDSSNKITGVKIDSHSTTTFMTFLTFPPRTSVTSSVVAIGGSITNQWGNDAAQPLPDVGSVGQNYDDGTSPYYDSIGNQVFRLEICFQRQNGSFTQYPAYTNSAPVYGASLSNTVAIVVAIAVLDSRSRKLVTTANWTALTAALRDPTDSDLAGSGGPPAVAPQLMDSIWNAAIQQPTFSSSVGIPAAVASHIKVYQRYYYLNAPKAQ